jgi:hypothetical protein
MAIGAVSAMLSPQVLNSTLFSFFWPVALGIFLSILSNLLRDNETERLLDEPIVASSYDAETIVVTDKD